MSLVKNNVLATVRGTVALQSNSTLNCSNDTRCCDKNEVRVLSAVTTNLNRMNMHNGQSDTSCKVGNTSDEDKENRKRKNCDSSSCHCGTCLLPRESNSCRPLQNNVQSSGCKFSNSKEDLQLDPSMGISYLNDSSADSDDSGPLLGSLLVHASCSNPNDFICKRRKIAERYSGPNPFDSLHNELILEVFKWLPKVSLVKCAQVCPRFKRLALDYSLWRRVDLNSRNLAPGTLGRVLLRGAMYLRLSKAEIAGPVFSPGLEHLPRKIESTLVFLDLSMATCEPGTLVEVLSVCRRLQKVSLEFLTVTDAVLTQLANSARLDTLNLSMCVGVRAAGLSAVLTRCRELRHLNLAWTYLSQACVQSLATTAPPSLETLNIAGHRHSQVRDEEVRSLCATTPNLRELDLSDCTEISSVSLQVIAAKLKRLSVLGLSRCYGLRCEDYAVLSALPQLQHLSLFGANDDSLKTVMRSRCPDVAINRHPFSTVARPTVGLRRTSIWAARVRDS